METRVCALELAGKFDLFYREDFFLKMESFWERVYLTKIGQACAKFGQSFCDFWANFLQICASLGKSFKQIRTYLKRFDQFLACPNFKGNTA